MVCETCSRQTKQQVLVPDGDLWHILCPSCADQLNSCGFCKNGGKCDFETNPSSLPKFVQKQIRQGNMISVTTVKNPERIRQTCQNGCPCYDSEFECMREFYYCERIDHVYEDNSERADSGATEDSGDGSEVHSEIHG
jgi:hypothetical protein